MRKRAQSAQPAPFRFDQFRATDAALLAHPPAHRFEVRRAPGSNAERRPQWASDCRLCASADRQRGPSPYLVHPSQQASVLLRARTCHGSRRHGPAKTMGRMACMRHSENGHSRKHSEQSPHNVIGFAVSTRSGSGRWRKSMSKSDYRPARAGSPPSTVGKAAAHRCPAYRSDICHAEARGPEKSHWRRGSKQ